VLSALAMGEERLSWRRAAGHDEARWATADEARERGSLAKRPHHSNHQLVPLSEHQKKKVNFQSAQKILKSSQMIKNTPNSPE
jgi:hypothetical protein